MHLKNRTLLIPEKADIERNDVAAAWTAMGGDVIRLGRFWDPPDSLIPSQVTLYGNDTFCLVLEQKLGLHLISPPDDLINTLSQNWLHREISVLNLEQAFSITYPCFIKPIVPKQFKAAVYQNPDGLKKECEGLEPQTQVIISPVVDFEAEARSFVLNGRVLDLSVYEGDGPAAEAEEFADAFCRNVELPSTCVIDVGYIRDAGWVFIEANASWGAGLNGCGAERIVPAILEATKTAEIWST